MKYIGNKEIFLKFRKMREKNLTLERFKERVERKDRKMNEIQKEYYKSITEFLFATFGETMEANVYEVGEDKKTRLCTKTKNSSKSHGDAIDKYLMPWIRHYDKEQKYVAKIPMKEKNGDLSRISLHFIPNEKGKLVGVLCIKKNITPMVVAANFLNQNLRELTGGPERNLETEVSKKGKLEEENTLLSYSKYMIDEYLESLNTPVDAMSIDDRVKIVEVLNKKGVFQLKGNITEVAKRLDISEKTLYRYLKN